MLVETGRTRNSKASMWFSQTTLPVGTTIIQQIRWSRTRQQYLSILTDLLTSTRGGKQYVCESVCSGSTSKLSNNCINTFSQPCLLATKSMESPAYCQKSKQLDHFCHLEIGFFVCLPVPSVMGGISTRCHLNQFQTRPTLKQSF